MNTQEIMDQVANIQKEMNEKAIQMLRKHLQSKLFSPLFQREMQKLEEDLAKNLPMTAERRDEVIEIMMDDLEASNQKPIIKTVPAAKKVIRAVNASSKVPEKKALLQSSEPDNSSEDQVAGFPAGIFAKIVEMLERQMSQNYAQANQRPENRNNADYVSSTYCSFGTGQNPVYTPPGMRQQTGTQPDAVYNPTTEKNLFAPPQYSAETRHMPQEQQTTDLSMYDPKNLCDVRNPDSPFYRNEQTVQIAVYHHERLRFHNPLYLQPNPLYSTELGKFTTIDDMEKYVIEQNRLIGKTAAARMLDFQVYQLDEITHSFEKAYDPAFPKPILFGSNTVRFRIGDILKYIKSKR